MNRPPKTDLDRLAEGYPLPTWQTPARLVMALVAAALVWANFARLDEVTVARGEVVPEGKVKVIQHLEGGVVRAIFAHEGDEVKVGAPLLELDLPASAMNRDEIQVHLDAQVLARARLHAQASGQPVAFPAEESKRQPVIVDAERRAFDAKTRELDSGLSVLQSQARQKELEVVELEAKQRAAAATLGMMHQKLAMSSDLLKEGLTAKMEHMQLSGEVQALDGELAALKAAVPRAQAAMAEYRQRQDEEKFRFARAAQEALAQIESDIARNRELLSQATGQQLRTDIRSPIDGIVKNLHQHTIGGVVRSGEPIMEIVPLHEKLQIEAKLAPEDRGYVTTGQRAMVKVSAYDYTRYGGLDGRVVQVAADTTIGPDNQAFFRVLVETDKAHLGEETTAMPIMPGMQATVEIHTGTRTVLEYLAKPVLKLRHEAFQER